ncbi:TlpA family protein disulfide reductase [Dokdonia sinensis]|uniref:TlpA family protein disulfide reductase n=1 Tax=Dokdonia sinensis TaxID=2479847 RepID=A0A3M0G630_9FLAO|nr:TlpA disulfide reductase family protein [Dokdonia sinensis]RMB60500.1 TlpA family protein disulfide reductase [Dokdonia sinensis]
MKNIFWFILILSALSCKNEPRTLKSGLWRATLEVQDKEQLPFIFESKEDGTLVIHNAEERILIDEIKIKGDSIRIQAPVFEGFFAGVFDKSGQTISGDFIKPSLDRIVPFEMVYGEALRFRESVKNPTQNISGNWETIFSPESDADRYIAKGIFSQKGNIITGTFRTTTGDYRYLEGTMDGNEFKLSTFDGAHAFLFTGSVTDSTMEGHFYSGNHWKEPFRAKRNENYDLPDAKELTYLKEGYDKLEFSFPDASGKMVSLDDERFTGKVTLVQLLGSWCPNCLEESKFYVDFLKSNPDVDLEVIGLAFEYALTEDKAWEGITRLKKRLGIDYPILLAQYGDSDKKKAQEKLPMLNHVISYPTTIYIDKKGVVRRIHTGYNGTATGKAHQDFKADFENFIATLTAE